MQGAADMPGRAEWSLHQWTEDKLQLIACHIWRFMGDEANGQSETLPKVGLVE